MIEYLPQKPADLPAIEDLLDRAFGPDRHAKASYQFREGVEPVPGLSWTAHDAGRLVATIRYWPIRVTPAGIPALLLGPIAVEPARRGEGIGVSLIRQTLAMAARMGHRIVLLVGELDYYFRFGFEPAAPRGLFMPREQPHRLLFVELAPGALEGISGTLERWDADAAPRPRRAIGRTG